MIRRRKHSWCAGTERWMGCQLGSGMGHCSGGVVIICVEPVPRHPGADLDWRGTHPSLQLRASLIGHIKGKSEERWQLCCVWKYQESKKLIRWMIKINVQLIWTEANSASDLKCTIQLWRKQKTLWLSHLSCPLQLRLKSQQLWKAQVLQEQNISIYLIGSPASLLSPSQQAQLTDSSHHLCPGEVCSAAVYFNAKLWTRPTSEFLLCKLCALI